MRPILNTEEDKPARGYIIFGRILDQQVVKNLGEQLHKVFTIEITDSGPSSIVDLSNNQYDIQLLNTDMLKISKLYIDDDGLTVFTISTKMQRTIIQSGRSITH